MLKLNYGDDMSTNLYVYKEKEYLDKINKGYLNSEKAEIKEIKNAIILPPKKQDNTTFDGIFIGGVATENFEFVAGKKRHKNPKFNYSCYDSYKVDEAELEYINEEVIYGGIIMDHFGHAILETFSRLWYVVKNKKDTRKIAFIKYQNVRSYHYELLRLMGIDEKRIIIVEKPTHFNKVIVPDETIEPWGTFKKEYTLIYNEMRKNVIPKNEKKIYLTRTQLEERYDSNEEWFEEFYSKRGYKVIAPEKLSLEEQIAFISGCEDLVCTLGTLSHLAVFMKNGSKLTILNRTTQNILEPQLIIDEAKKLNVTYIDALLTVLPSPHTAGCACMYPNEHFINYLKDNKIKYEESELNLDKDKVIIEYIKKWVSNFSIPNRFGTIANYDICDVVINLNNILNENKIDASMIYKGTGKKSKRKWIEASSELEKENKYLKEEIIKLREDIGKKEKQIKKIKNSKSWKITQPLRKISKLLKRKHTK